MVLLQREVCYNAVTVQCPCTLMREHAMEITLETTSSQLVTAAGRCGTTQCDNNNTICVTKIPKLSGLLNSYKLHATLLSFLYFLLPTIWTPLQTSLVLINDFTRGELFSRSHKIT